MTNGMKKPSPYRPKRRRLCFVFFFLFLMAMAPMHKAVAQCCAADAVTAANTSNSFASWLSQLGLSAEMIANIIAIYNYFQNNIAPALASQTTSTVATNIFLQNTLHNLGTYLANYYQVVAQQILAAINMQKKVIPNQSIAAQWQVLGQSIDQADQCVGWVAAAQQVMVTQDCTGPGANCSGPGRATEARQDLCHLGFISQNQSFMCTDTNYQAPPDNSYADRDKNYSYCLNADQMSLPPAVCILKDGYISWSAPDGQNCQQGQGNAVATLYNQDISQSQLAWIACYKACEYLAPQDQPQFYLDHPPTVNDDRTFMDLRRANVGHLGLQALCMKALWERTAVPQSAAGVTQLIGGGGNNTNTITNCAQAQTAVCYNMERPANPNSAYEPGGSTGPPNFNTGTTGVGGTTGIGIQSDQYLQNCVTNGAGLSTVNRERILAERCQDTNFIGQMANWERDASQVEHNASFECVRLWRDWNDKKDQEIRDLLPQFENAVKERQAAERQQ